MTWQKENLSARSYTKSMCSYTISDHHHAPSKTTQNTQRCPLKDHVTAHTDVEWA